MGDKIDGLDSDDRLLNQIPEMPEGGKHTIVGLRLDLASAAAGKTWLLLPEGFRTNECGQLYPLPSARTDIQKLVAIPIPRNKRDCGTLYLKRALKEWKSRQEHRQSAALNSARVEQQVVKARDNFTMLTKELRAEARAAVDEVRAEAQKAVASLNDLFALGRQGIEGQMKAHIAGTEWQGEKIDAEGFRRCFRMVSQAVKGLGLPTEQRDRARDAVMEEFAASLKDTQEAVAMAPGAGEEKPQ